MEIGDRVKVINVDDVDRNTSLFVGMEGKITGGGVADDIFRVTFDDVYSFNSGGNSNMRGNGYQMYCHQLKVITTPEVNSDLFTGIATMREIYDTSIKVGFSTEQAFEIVKMAFCTAMEK